MYEQKRDETKEKLEEVKKEIKLVNKTIPDYIKSSSIFWLVAKIGMAILLILLAFMQTIDDKKAFLTILILTVAATVASISDKNMAKSQQAKRDELYDEQCELEKILEN